MYRLCRSSDASRVTHVEHSGGLTFCGKDAGFYSGLTYLPTLAAARSHCTCRRCQGSIARWLRTGEVT